MFDIKTLVEALRSGASVEERHGEIVLTGSRKTPTSGELLAADCIEALAVRLSAPPVFDCPDKSTAELLAQLQELKIELDAMRITANSYKRMYLEARKHG